MPGRNIKQEKADISARQTAIGRELRAAQGDFKEAEESYKYLVNEFKKLEKLHLRKVREGEPEGDMERQRYEMTKQDILETRRCLEEKERTLIIARSAEYNFQKERYEMMQRSRDPLARFFNWVVSIPTRVADKIMDITLVNAEAKRIAKLPEKERQDELRKMRAVYSLDQEERKMERVSTTQAKDFILDHPEVGIRNYHELDEKQKDMITMEKMVSLCCRTGQTIFVGIGNERLVRLELMDDEINDRSGYVSIKLCVPERDEQGHAALKEEGEIGHIHVINENRDEWTVDIQSSSKTRLEAALAIAANELSTSGEERSRALRHLTKEEMEIVAEVTMTDTALKRAALAQEFGEITATPVKGKDVPAKESHEKEPGAVIEGGDSEKKENSRDDEKKKSIRKEEQDKGTLDRDRQATEKKIEKAIKELHEGYRKDKDLSGHKVPVSIMVDRYNVSICPPNAKNPNAHYKVDGRYAGNYMKSRSNPAITMDYIRNHKVLENPIKTISPDKLDDLQLSGNIARGLLYDVNHRANDVPAYLADLKESGREINTAKILQFVNSDIGKYPIQEAAEAMSAMFHKIQSLDMDDRLRESPAAAVYQAAYKKFMGEEEMTHPGEFNSRDVDYVGSDGTLYDKEGKLFLSNDGGIITIDNCQVNCPPEEAGNIREALQEMRRVEIASVDEIIEPETEQESRADGGREMQGEEKEDWLQPIGDVQFNSADEIPFGPDDDRLSSPFDGGSLDGPDFGLQNELDFAMDDDGIR